MFDRLKDYDLRYLVQITIKLFDQFCGALMNENVGVLRALGLETASDLADAKALRQLLLASRY
jgi:hypothetical protein